MLVYAFTWFNNNYKVLMKIQIDTIPTRITTYFQREVCSRRKTNTYYYHKRKWNKKVTSNSKTGTKQTFTILTDEHVSLIHSVCSGSTLRIIMMVQCFAVVDSLYSWGITGNNHLTSATKHRKFKRLMRGIK